MNKLTKKILYILTVTIIPIVFVVPLYFFAMPKVGESSLTKNLKDFDWSNSDLGDGITYNPYNDNYQANLNTDSNINTTISPDYYKNYFDYDKLNTGFQWNQNISKQMATGVPLNKGFMPNGNFAVDFGIGSPAQAYRQLNSILTWDPSIDADAKYNRSQKDLRKSEFVAKKNVASQDERLNFDYLGFSTRKHRTFDNTIVGTKNPFENTNLNWQYNNVFVNWSGSWFEGPVIPPPADTIEMAHNNGGKIYGNVFLDGTHGLTGDMLRDFIAQNSDGSYKVVDKLIQIAAYEGFDGWFINNEANGYSPNGTVLDYKSMEQMIKEYHNKTSISNDPKVKNQKLIYYRNASTVKYSALDNRYYDNETVDMASTIYKNNDFTKKIELQVNFGETPDSTTQFLKDHPDYTGSDIYGLVNSGWEAYLHGFYDYKNLAYKRKVLPDGTYQFDKDVYTSISAYEDEGPGQFAAPASALSTRPMDLMRKYLFMAQVQHLYNDVMYSGVNLFIDDKVEGYSENTLQRTASSTNHKTEFVKADPRIHFDKEYQNDSRIKGKSGLYDYEYNDKNKGVNSHSFGIGNLIREKTVFTDENLDNSYLTTNFSTGSGIKFAGTNSVINYPWTNKRLADILPTYKWRIFDTDHPDEPLRIDEFAGGYDYDQVYKKGNSIVIGNGFDETGQIVESEYWNPNTTYGWDIMGTNIAKNDKKISIVYNDNQTEAKNKAEVKLRLTFADNNGSASWNNSNVTILDPQSIVDKGNGWTEISYDLSKVNNISETHKLAAIGLNIKPKVDKFKFNVGELSVIDNSYLKNDNQVNISNPKSEYVVYRDRDDEKLNNIRFSWDASNYDAVDYFEIYVLSDEKWYRVGETTQTKYYLRDLTSKNGVTIAIKPILKNKEREGELYKFKLNL
ncbi:endo-beta-N-acetylglucosaminidase [Spiroplasma helicoides]|uniref:Endo-beta-N-acetylglucosaminidase n=1 Tax=Spiroplasma helicoides TaxID=216938 RepID=A0A1B3SM41_9MOLU|nr:hypothetical protein [Spiroplasma helicoides]AOG60980.1 endo-beta-N-acetylglucosaminidase [Spiroplasma helicoides]